MIYLYFVSDRINFNAIKEPWDILDCAYNERDYQETAKRELAMLKQGIQEFSVYFADFQPVTGHGRVMRWKAVEGGRRRWKDVEGGRRQ